MRQRSLGWVVVTVLAVLSLGSSRVYALEVNEIEPNDTSAQADANGAFTGDVMIAGSILPAGDLDRYRLDLAANQVVRLETFGEETYTSGKECDPTVEATVITVFAADGVTQVMRDGQSSGINNCAALVLQLNSGTYYVQVRSRAKEIPTYKLQIKIQAPAGAEAEPNPSRATATPIAGSDVYEAGSHLAANDVDYYAITVPATGASVRAEVIEADASAACNSGLMDSELVLENASGTVLVDDDNGGRGLCSRIDGRGAFPTNPGAHDLAPGTYYLRVISSPTAGLGPTALFNYRLAVTIVAKDVIFTDGWESGDLSAWTTAETDNGHLRASNLAGMTGNWGMRAEALDTNPMFVEDDTPLQENQYRARFHFDTVDFDPGVAQGHLRVRLLIGFAEAPTRRVFAMVLRKSATGQYALEVRTRLDSGLQADTGFVNITAGMHRVEVLWTRASTPGASDGVLRLWIDGHTQEVNLQGLQNNGVGQIDFVRLGALTVKSGASGNLYFDNFVSHRWTYIGP